MQASSRPRGLGTTVSKDRTKHSPTSGSGSGGSHLAADTVPFFDAPASGASDAGPSSTNTVADSTSAADLQCPICEEVMFRPVRTRCGHHFCKACLLMWLRTAPEPTCPNCRGPLDGWNRIRTLSHEADGDDRIPAAFIADASLERRAMATLGHRRYGQRGEEQIDDMLAKKLEEFRERRRKVGDVSALCSVPISAAAAIAAPTAAMGSCVLPPTESIVATTAAVGVGVAIGAGCAAFMSGMKLAAWLDDHGRYALIGMREERRHHRSCVVVTNKLDEIVVARVFAAQTVEISPARSFMNQVGKFAGVCSEECAADTRRLEAVGPPIAERTVVPECTEELDCVLPRESNRLLLSVNLPGILLDTTCGTCKVRAGWKYYVCEVKDGLSPAMLKHQSSGSE